MSEDLHNYHHHINRPNEVQGDDGFIKFLVDYTEAEAPEVDENIAFIEVKRKISISKYSFPWLKIAASISIIALVSLAFITYMQSPEIITISSVDTRLQVTFPDGSTGVLNENSSLSYLESFDNERSVQLLKGEVFFDVQEDEVPFVINAGEVEVEVLGTSFNLSKDKEQVRLDVQDGLVAFRSAGEQSKVAAGFAASYDRTKGLISEEVAAINAISWLNGKLVFDNVSLDVVLDELSSYYNVKFKLKNEQLAACKVSATFNEQELSQVLETLHTLLELEISRKGKSIQISGEGC